MTTCGSKNWFNSIRKDNLSSPFHALWINCELSRLLTLLLPSLVSTIADYCIWANQTKTYLGQPKLLQTAASIVRRNPVKGMGILE
jgi:hypothetical protein